MSIPHYMKLVPRIKMILVLFLFSVLLFIISPNQPSASSENTTGPTTLVYPPFSHCFGLHRVGQTHLSLYSGYKKKFRSPEGMAAVKLIFNDKRGPNDDDELTVYGVNSGAGEIIYNKSLVSLGFFGGVGKGNGEFLTPTGISADAEGTVVVADTGNDRLVFLENVENELHFRKIVTLSESDKSFLSPSGVAMENDSIYVTDTGNDRIVVLDKNGRYARTVVTSLKLFSPFGIAVIGKPYWNQYYSRFIALTDSLYQRLIIMGFDGRVRRIIRYGEVSDRSGGFFYIAIDHYSNIYVTDRISGCLYKFDRNLNLLARMFCRGESDIELDEPRGIAIHRRFGQIFVAEKAGASYFWVGTDIINLSCRVQATPEATILHLSFFLTEKSTVKAWIEGCNGEVIETVMDEETIPSGNVKRIYRLGKILLPKGMAKCDYRFRIEAKPTYSAKTYLIVSKSVAIIKFQD